jgi:hypothetical protein
MVVVWRCVREWNSGTEFGQNKFQPIKSHLHQAVPNVVGDRIAVEKCVHFNKSNNPSKVTQKAYIQHGKNNLACIASKV